MVDTLRSQGYAEVPAHEIGLAILGPLRQLDEVAYLRFASVYRAFESADDFEDEIALLRAERGVGSTVVEALGASAASLETRSRQRAAADVPATPAELVESSPPQPRTG